MEDIKTLLKEHREELRRDITEDVKRHIGVLKKVDLEEFETLEKRVIILEAKSRTR